MAIESASDIFGGGAPADTADIPPLPAPQGQEGFSSASDLFGGNLPEGGPSGNAATPLSSYSRKSEEPAGFFDGVKYGAREALNPFNVDRGEQEHAMSSGLSTTGYLLSNIATSLGVNAALTTATGGAAGALGVAREAATAKNIATGLYALYQGLGRDRIRTRDEGRSWKPMDGGRGTATALLTSALELNPLMKASGKLSAALRVGAQGAGEAIKEKVYGESNETAAWAAAMGVVGAAIPLSFSKEGGKAVEAVTKDTVESALETKTPEIFTAAKAKMAEMEKSRPDFASPDALANVSSDFKRSLVGDFKAELGEKELETAFAARSKQMGGKKLDEAYTLMMARNAFGDAAGDATEARLKEMGMPFKEPSLGERLLMPMFYVSRQIDEATGLDTAKLVDKFTQAHNRHNTIAERFTKRLLPLQKEAKQLGLSGEDVSQLITMEDPSAYKAIVAKLGEEKASDYRSRLQEVVSGETGMLGYLKELGYSPTARQNYMPMKAVSSVKMASILTGEMEALPKALGNRTLNQVRVEIEQASKTKGSLEALLAQDKAAATVSLIDKTAERLNMKPIKALQDFSGIKEHLLSGGRWAEQTDGIPDGLTEIAALFARKGEVPGQIRENDAWKLLGGYLNENLRAAHFEDALNYGRMYVGVLDKMGMKKSSELFENYVKDQAGGARFLAGAMRKLNAKIEFSGAERVRKAVGKWDERLGKNIEAAPEFVSWLNSLVYPAKLALNVPGMIRNTTQFMATTIPELGSSGMYGTKKAAAAAKAALQNPEGMKKIVAEMEDKGLFSNHGRLETSEFAKAFGGVKGTIDKANEKLFTMYQATDKFNRVLTWKMGREVAADILADSPDAIKFLGSLDSSTKQHLRNVLKQNMGGKEKLDAVHDIVGRYLISKTQFDYSAANKAEWARLAGPMFSMFTTWPAMVGGDMVDVMKNKGAIQGGKKLLSKYLPFYGMAAMAQSYFENDDKSELSKKMGIDTRHATKYLMGGTKSYSPLDSVLPTQSPMPGRGGLLTNPLIDTTMKLGKSVATGDLKGFGRSVMTDVLPTYLPVVSPILNEVDRYNRITTGTKATAKMADKLGLKKEGK